MKSSTTFQDLLKLLKDGFCLVECQSWELLAVQRLIAIEVTDRENKIAEMANELEWKIIAVNLIDLRKAFLHSTSGWKT